MGVIQLPKIRDTGVGQWGGGVEKYADADAVAAVVFLLSEASSFTSGL